MKRAQDNRGIKDPAFRIPEGYFETLPDRLQARLAAAESGSAPSGAGGKVVPLRRRHYRWTAAAAAIALLLGIGLAVRPDDRSEGFALLNDKSMLTNFKNVLADANIPVGSGIRNSLIVSACSAALSVYFSALTAYGIYAYNFRFKKAAFAIILLIMTMPTQVSALGFLQLITKMGLKNSFIPLIVPSIAAPTVFFFMKQYLDASLPMEIVEAARIDGAGEFYTFNHIVLPIMKPALAVQAIFSFVASWNNYFIPALVLDSADKKTLPILIAQLRSADFLKFDMGKVYMMVAIAILPVIVVYLLLSKFIVRGIALGGVKG